MFSKRHNFIFSALIFTFFSFIPLEKISAQTAAQLATQFPAQLATQFPAQTGVSLAAEIQSIENEIAKQSISPEIRHAALVRLAGVRQLSGDIEGAARNWLEAAAAIPGSVDDNALLSCAYCLAAMGEWQRASAALQPLLSRYPRARFLDACVRAIETGDHSELGSLVDNPEYSNLKPEIIFVLWKITQGASKDRWRQRLVNEFPQTPEGRLAREESSGGSSSIVIMPSPFWLFAGGLDSLLQIEPQPSSSQPSSAARLQTGLFGRHANAQAQEAALKQAGFTAIIESRTVNGNEMWAVTVTAGSDANRTIAQLRDAGFESFPVR